MIEFVLSIMIAIWATVAVANPDSQSAQWVNAERRQFFLMYIAWAMLGVDILAEIVRQSVKLHASLVICGLGVDGCLDAESILVASFEVIHSACPWALC